MKYEVRIAAGAAREIRKLPAQVCALVLEEISKLADDPLPPGVRKLAGVPDGYRVRKGDYRIVYTIEDNILKIDIVTVGHRDEVYQNLAEKVSRRGR